MYGWEFSNKDTEMKKYLVIGLLFAAMACHGQRKDAYTNVDSTNIGVASVKAMFYYDAFNAIIEGAQGQLINFNLAAGYIDFQGNGSLFFTPNDSLYTMLDTYFEIPAGILIRSSTDTIADRAYARSVGGGSGISFGTDNQLPYTNGSGTDFDYSSNFTYDGSTLSVINGSSGNGLFMSNSSTGYGISINNATSGRGLYVSNPSTGHGVYVFNTSSGHGLFVNNTGTGNSLTIRNNSVDAFIVSSEGTVSQPFYTASFGTPTTIDFANGNNQTLTVTGDVTINLTSVPEGICTIEIIQDGTGGWVITPGTGWGNPQDNNPSFTITANKYSVVRIITGSKTSYTTSVFNN